MGNELLPALGALTLGGSIAVILFALAGRASRARYGARWRCWIWALLCLRLVIPVSLLSLVESGRQAPIQLSLPSDPVLYAYNAGSAPAVPTGDFHPAEPSSAGTGPAAPAEGTQAAEDWTRRSISLSEVVFLLWLAGAAVMGAWLLISHVRFLRYVRRWSRPVQASDVIRLYNQTGDQLKLDRRPALGICAGLSAPMLAGLLRPVLLLPEDLPEGDAMRCALVHELTHFKRRDIWLKTLALLANLVHWFNPLMWYMVRLELACDEAVLRRLPPEEHAAYSRTILGAAARLDGQPRPGQNGKGAEHERENAELSSFHPPVGLGKGARAAPAQHLPVETKAPAGGGVDFSCFDCSALR